jgi:hypothetical protein
MRRSLDVPYLSWAGINSAVDFYKDFVAASHTQLVSLEAATCSRASIYLRGLVFGMTFLASKHAGYMHTATLIKARRMRYTGTDEAL